jgi:hypothetical protein
MYPAEQLTHAVLDPFSIEGAVQIEQDDAPLPLT